MKNEYWYHKIDLGETPGVYRMSDYLDKYHLPKDMTSMKVLDLASAEGYFSFEMEKRGANVIAVELYDEPIKHFNLVKQYFGYKTEVFKVDILDSVAMQKFDKFDIVFAFNILQHFKLEQKEKFIEILKEIKKDKIIIATSDKKDVELLKNNFDNVVVHPSFVMNGYKEKNKTNHYPDIIIIELLNLN